MKFNKKYCLLFLMTVLVLLLGAGMVSASEAGSDVQVVKDNQGLSTPDNYDVDNVVQSDLNTKSDANVEKTSTKYDTKLNSENDIDTFVNTTDTNEDVQTITSGSGHSAKVSVNEISGRTLNVACLENSGLLQETIDVGKISVSSYDSLAGSEDMTPILTSETTESSDGLVDTNTKSSVKSQETEKTIVKVENIQDIKAADGDLPEKIRANVTIVWDDFDNKYNSRPTSSSYYTYYFYRNTTSTLIRVYYRVDLTNQTALLDKYDSQNREYTNFRLTTSSKPTGYLDAVITNSSKVYEETVGDVTYSVTEYDYQVKYTLQNITLKVYKKWNDSSDYDKVRPAEYSFNIYANGQLNNTDPITKPKSTTTTTYNNVPVIDDEGNEIVWTVEEVNVHQNYTVEKASYIASARTLQWNLTNIHIPKKVIWNVTVLWDDNDNQDGKRSSISAYIRNNNQTSGQTSFSLTSNNNWHYNTTKYKLVNGVDANYNYYSGYTTTLKNAYIITESNTTEELDSGDILINYRISMKHTPETRNITVKKIWDDYNNKDNLRPDSITVNLTANGDFLDSVILSQDNNWNYTFENLQVYSAGSRISYACVEEGVPEKYISRISSIGPSSTLCEITNSYRTEVNVTGTWDDADNRDEARPFYVPITLYKNGEEYSYASITENNWKYTFNDLLIYDEEGNENIYTISERTPSYYISDITNENKNFNIKYTYTPNITLNITKTWDDMDDLDGFRPDHVLVKILANGEQYGDLINITEENNWNYLVTDLPKYLDGDLIEYTIEEIVPDGYTEVHSIVKELKPKNKSKLIVECLGFVEDDELGFRIYAVNLTNDVIDEGTVTVYDDEGNIHASGDLSEGSLFFAWDPEKDFEITVNYTGTDYYLGNTTSFNESDVYITWDGYFISPWTMSDNLAAYCIMMDKPRGPSRYYYIEDGVIYAPQYYSEGYQLMPYSKSLLNETIISPRTEEDVLAYVRTLIFYHAHDNQNFSLENGLNLNLAPLIFLYLEGTPGSSGRYSGENYEDSRTYRSPEITRYTDVLVENYERVQNGEAIDNHGVFKETSGGLFVYQFYRYDPIVSSTWQSVISMELIFVPDEVEYKVDITNTHVPEFVNLTVNKVWDDADDKDGLRPEVINLRFLVNGVYNETIALEEANNWTKSYYDLPKYSEGSLVNYTFEEINVPEGYNVSYSSLARDPTKIDTVIHCEFAGLNEGNSLYRFHVTNLTNDLIYGGELDIYNSSGSLITVGGLYESDGGYLNLTWPSDKEFNVRAIYRDNRNYMECDMWFDESNIGDVYIDTFRPDYNITVRNTHIPKTINFTVTKVWNDTDDRDGFRPDSITVKLLVNGEESDDYVATLNQDNHWTYTFEELPEIVDGQKVEYTVGEIDCPEEYEVVYGPVINVSEDKKQEVNIAFGLSDLNEDEEGNIYGTFTVVVKDETDEFVTEGNIFIYNETGSKVAEGTVENGILIVDLPVTLSEDKVYPINRPKFPEIIFNYTIVYEENQYYLGNDATYTFEDINNFWISKSLLYSPWQLTDGSWTFCISADKEGTPTDYGMNYLPIYSDFNMTNIITKEDMTPYILTFLYNHMYDTENFTASPYNPNIAGEHIQRIINVFLGYGGKNYRNFDHSDTYNTNTKSGHDLTYFIEETIRQVEYGQAVQRHGIRNVTDDGVWKYDFYEYKPYAEYFGNTQWQHIITLTFTFVPNVIEMETTITNTHISENVTINVTKVWNDSDNQDGIRPNNITVALYKGYELYDNVTLSEDNDWKHTFTDLPKYENGELIDYGVYEVIVSVPYTKGSDDVVFIQYVPDGYTLEIEVSEYNFTLTNTHVPETTNITVVKNWTDDDNKVGLRPDHVVVQLYANGVEEGSPVVLEPDEDGVWKYDFNDLDLYYNHGKPISYTIKEIVPNSYIETYNYTVNITISSLGIDAPEGTEPESDVVYLLADGEVVDSVEISDIFAEWDHTFTDLPVYDESDKLINYTFAYEYEGEYYNLDPYYHYNVTCIYSISVNNRITGIRTVSVSKVWDDADDNDGIRPDEVTVELVIDGVPSGQTITLYGPEFEDKFENLPMYHENGTLIVYNVTEVETDVPEGYTLSNVVSCGDGFKVINTHVPENISINVTKVWKDENDNDGVRPANVTVILLQNGEEFRTVVLNATGGWKYTFNNLPKYYDEGKEYIYNVTEVAVSGYTMSVSNNSAYNFTITNSHELELTELNVTKVWNDSDNQDGLRVPEVHVILMDDDEEIRDTYLNAGNGWKYTFTELVKYRDGKLIEYTLVEDDVDDYDTEIVFNNGVFTVTNTHIPENISVNVTKVWTDNENQDGVRPANVTVKLLQNGEEYKTVVLSEDNEWYYLFENLPKFYNNGNITKYEIVEVAVPGYTTVVSNVSTEFTVNNTHVPENTSVNVSKIWNDADNNDAVRPNNVTITLVIDGVVSDNKVQINSTNWNYTFENLPKYRDGGIPIVYNVTEDTVDDYTTEIVFCEGRFKVINTHVPEVVNKTVNKIWDDAENQDDMRPTKVTITLKSSDGNKYVAVIEEVNGKWNYTFTDLPKYSNGQELVYTVEESVIPDGYSVDYDQDTLTITNNHDVLTKDISVTKVWDDADTAKDRPENITVYLLADNEVVANLTLTGDEWADKFTDLPVYKEGEVGVEIVYSIKELTVANYTTTITNISDDWTITNTHIPELVDVTVNKVWNDSENQDGIRPAEVTLKLNADGQEYIVKVVETVNGDLTYTFTDLPKYSNGQEIVYTVEEVNVANGYTVTYSEDTLTITNTHIPEVTDVSVVKLWDDAEDNDGKRPYNVTVELVADGKVINTTVLDEDNNWEYTFTALPKFSNGVEIVYSITESVVPDEYSVKVVYCEGVFKVVNSYVPENTTVTVVKIWEDNNNQDAIRPDSIFVSILANGEEYKIVKLTAENDWAVIVSDLPKYDNGQEITYTVEEASVPSGYTAVVDGLTITNIHIPEVTSVNVTKVWKDNNNNDGVRPESVTINLFADGVEYDSAILNEGNDWSYTFNNLPLNKDGRKVSYTVSEDNVEGYTTSLVICNGTFKFINTYDDSKVNITINKVWEDNDNQDAIRPENVTVEVLANGERYDIVVINSTSNWQITVENLPEFINGQKVVYTVREIRVERGYTSVVDGFTITNKHDPITYEIEVTKIWKDNNNNDGLRPDSVIVNLLDGDEIVATETLSADNDWKVTFKDLPMNKAGKFIEYTVDEVEVDGYSTEIVDCSGDFKIVNTHIDALVNVTVEKVWVDDNNNDGIRPKTVSVRLLADGVEYAIGVVTGDDWTYTFTNLPEFKDGKKVTYTVEEVEVPSGYIAVVDGLTITNTHEPFTKEINVTKVWNDNNNALRPESVTVHLMDGEKVVATATLSADNDWKATFKDLPVNKDGKAIVYTIKEDQVPDYTTEIKDCCGNFKIVNTIISYPINITVNKVWNDNNNNDKLRPNSINVRLLADGEKVEDAVITGDDWTYTFTNLPEFKDGKKVTYTVEEVEVPSGYVASADALTITNTHIDITKNITVSKFWDDDNNNDGIRPESVTIHLFADDTEVASTTLSADNDWKDTFEDLPVNKDGKAIEYTITEDPVDSYNVSIINADDEFIVTNSYNITKINLTVNKVWVDENNNDGLRPSSITVVLYDDGEEVMSAIVKDSDDWTYTFCDLPKYNNGHEIKYTIDEFSVEDYAVSVDGLTITNTHRIITKDIPVTKVWVDDNNNDGTRPESITVNLYADGEKVSSMTITESDDWEGIFKDLPVYKAGNEIVYTIVEEDVPDYRVSYEDNVIINTHDLVNTSVTVTKIWNDSNNNDGVRPDSVSVNLNANGVKVSSILLSSNNSWTHTFDKLPKYENGQIINYTVDEEVDDTYDVTITKDSNYFIIINNRNIEQINLTINKIWDDKDNYYGKRPVNVTIIVFKGEDNIASVVLNEDNNWTCELTNLPKYENGELIKYNVDEVNITYYHYSIEANDDYSFTVTNTLNNVRVFKWAWKLIGDNGSYYEPVETEDKIPANKVVSKNTKFAAKGKQTGKYQPRYNIPNKKKYSWNKNKGKQSSMRKISWQWYRLYIYLYNEYFYGNMSYSEFVAILQLNGIQIDESNAWDSNGTLIFEYDTLEEVPDSIELHDNGGHVKDSSDGVDKYKPRSDSGVIDSGEVVAEVVDVEE